ncbi:hypothetical protein ACJX0J_012447, partial [Zea mays]
TDINVFYRSDFYHTVMSLPAEVAWRLPSFYMHHFCGFRDESATAALNCSGVVLGSLLI